MPIFLVRAFLKLRSGRQLDVSEGSELLREGVELSLGARRVLRNGFLNLLLFSAKNLCLCLDLVRQVLREEVQLEEPYIVGFRDRDPQLVEELLLHAEKADELNHLVVHFVLTHDVDVVNLRDDFVDIIVHGLHFIPDHLVLCCLLVACVQELREQMVLELRH